MLFWVFRNGSDAHAAAANDGAVDAYPVQSQKWAGNWVLDYLRRTSFDGILNYGRLHYILHRRLRTTPMVAQLLCCRVALLHRLLCNSIGLGTYVTIQIRRCLCTTSMIAWLRRSGCATASMDAQLSMVPHYTDCCARCLCNYTDACTTTPMGAQLHVHRWLRNYDLPGLIPCLSGM
jgi:hypothetical protein